jgi:ubiquitin-protein ligase
MKYEITEYLIDDPMLPELAKRLKNDPDGYEQTVRSWVKKYAT